MKDSTKNTNAATEIVESMPVNRVEETWSDDQDVNYYEEDAYFSLDGSYWGEGEGCNFEEMVRCREETRENIDEATIERILKEAEEEECEPLDITVMRALRVCIDEMYKARNAIKWCKENGVPVFLSFCKKAYPDASKEEWEEMATHDDSALVKEEPDIGQLSIELVLDKRNAIKRWKKMGRPVSQSDYKSAYPPGFDEAVAELSSRPAKRARVEL